MKPYILHITGDFPDPLRAEKPGVIRSLIDLTRSDFEHEVVSINRTSPTVRETTKTLVGNGKLRIHSTAFNYGTAIEYLAPSHGLLHRSKLIEVAKWITRRVSREGRRPDLVLGHKLTIEGIIAAFVARQLGIPYGLSIQGNTDTRIVRARPDLRSVFREIFHNAQIVFPFTPWALKTIEGYLGARSRPTHILPCPTELDTIQPPKPGANGLVSVFHLRNHKLKNLKGIAQAFGVLTKRGARPPLEIVGGGTDKETATCRTIVADYPNITFTGPLEPDQVSVRLNRSSALLAPSNRESFGLVLIEALFAGAPIIYPKGRAIDGFFDDLPFALGVEPSDPKSIAEAMAHALEDEVKLKEHLADWQLSGALEPFTREAITKRFRTNLNAAVANGP